MRDELLFDEHVINKYEARKEITVIKIVVFFYVTIFFFLLKANIEYKNESFIVAVAVYICHLLILSGSRWCVYMYVV